MTPLPSGTVTFLFTDLEGSTGKWEKHPDAMRDALARHDAILRETVEAHDGHVVKSTGDGIHAVFASAPNAVSAATDVACAFSSEMWDAATGPLRVRIGIHTGISDERDGDYFGLALNRASRLMAAAHGGQIVLSRVSADLVRDGLPDDVGLLDLGEHRLRGLERPEQVYELTIAGVTAEFPPLQSLGAFPGALGIARTDVRTERRRTRGPPRRARPARALVAARHAKVSCSSCSWAANRVSARPASRARCPTKCTSRVASSSMGAATKRRSSPTSPSSRRCGPASRCTRHRRCTRACTVWSTIWRASSPNSRLEFVPRRAPSRVTPKPSAIASSRRSRRCSPVSPQLGRRFSSSMICTGRTSRRSSSSATSFVPHRASHCWSSFVTATSNRATTINWSTCWPICAGSRSCRE